MTFHSSYSCRPAHMHSSHGKVMAYTNPFTWSSMRTCRFLISLILTRSKCVVGLPKCMGARLEASSPGAKAQACFFNAWWRSATRIDPLDTVMEISQWQTPAQQSSTTSSAHEPVLWSFEVLPQTVNECMKFMKEQRGAILQSVYVMPSFCVFGFHSFMSISQNQQSFT